MIEPDILFASEEIRCSEIFFILKGMILSYAKAKKACNSETQFSQT